MVKESNSKRCTLFGTEADDTRDTLKAAAAIAAWFACSVFLIFGNKYILTELDFPFPITLTSWHLLVATIATQFLRFCTSKLDDVEEANKSLNWPKWSRAVLPIGALFSIALALSNYAYLYLSVSFIQMLKSGTPIAILLASWAFGTDQPNIGTFLNVAAICLGVSIASYGEIQFSSLGFFFAVTAVCFESIRLVMVQRLLKDQGITMSSLTALYYIAPICLFFNVCTALALEVPKLTWAMVGNVGLGNFAINGIASFGLNVASVMVIKYTSTLVLGLSGLFKDIIIVITSLFVFQIPISGLQWLGYAIALVAVARYKLQGELPWRVCPTQLPKVKKALPVIGLVFATLIVAIGITLCFIIGSSKIEEIPVVQAPAHQFKLAWKQTGPGPNPPTDSGPNPPTDSGPNPPTSSGPNLPTDFGPNQLQMSQRRQLTVDNMYKMGDIQWPQYFDNLDPALLAPLTREVQEWIYQKQHPPKEECRNRKFVVIKSGWWPAGLGSMVHVLGRQFGAALESGRIMVFTRDGFGVGQGYVDQGCGRHEQSSNLECLFQPLSSCTYEDATAPGVDHLNTTDHFTRQISRKFNEAPSIWKGRLSRLYPNLAMTTAFFKYWWRAQSAAYIMRLNKNTSDIVRGLRRKASINRAWTSDSSEGMPMPYPMPVGTVSLHVRHGDKAHEMRLIPFQDYVDTALLLSGENPLSPQRRLFVSSEDPAVIREARRLPTSELDPEFGPSTRWEVYTSRIPRLNSGPIKQLNKFGRQTMSYFWLLQLLMALECDAWVGTRGSNWNRLIDELRCVYVDRCLGVYHEVGPKEDWAHYNW